MGQPFLVQMPNRPGELAHLARALCARGVGIDRINSTAAGDTVSARIETNCCEDDTRDVLKSMGYEFVMGSTITVEIEDTSCAFADINDRLTAAGINLHDYSVANRAGGRATWVLTVDNAELARDLLGLPEADPATAG
jgi:hypothetical protein